MVYILPLFILIYCTIKYSGVSLPSKKSNTWLWIIALSFIGIAAFRFEIGADTAYSYMPDYDQYPSLGNLKPIDFDMTNYQPGWVVLNSICKSISDSFYTFQTIHALILNLTIIFFLKRNTKNVFAALLVYYIMNYLEYNTECLREAMAISFSLIAYEFYKSKKYIFVLLFAFLAFNFHISALGALLIPLLYKVKFSKKSFTIILLLALVSPFIYQALPDQTQLIMSLTGRQDMSSYYNNQFSQTLNTNYYIMHVAIYVFIPFFLAYYSMKHSDGRYIGFAYAFSILQMLAVFSYAFYRLSNYIAPFYWIMIADCIRIFLSSNRQGIRKAIFILYVCIGIYLYQGRLLQPDTDSRVNINMKIYDRYFPYKTWLFEDNI